MSFNFQYPHPLTALLPRVHYKGWRFEVRSTDPNIGLGGMAMLYVYANVQDSITGQPMQVSHEFIIPAVSMTETEWRRWLFDRIVLVETHEAMEFFWVDADRPFFPEHGFQASPYRIVDGHVG